MTPKSPPKPNNGGCLVAVVIVGLIVAVAKCSSSPGGFEGTTPAAKQVGEAQQALVSAVSAQTAPPVQELSGMSLRRGVSRVGMTSKEGPAGEMIYSQNCYDALGRAFTWKKLDECGGFDAEASLSLGDEEPAGFEKEVAWFDSEAAAGRYLKAVVAAGQDSDSADSRLAGLQAEVGRRHKVATEPIPSPAITNANSDGGKAAPSADGGEGVAAEGEPD